MKHKETHEEYVERLKKENFAMRELLLQAVKGSYGIWSAWIDKVKKVLEIK